MGKQAKLKKERKLRLEKSITFLCQKYANEFHAKGIPIELQNDPRIKQFVEKWRTND